MECNNFGNKASSYLSGASFTNGIELIRDFDTKNIKYTWGLLKSCRCHPSPSSSVLLYYSLKFNSYLSLRLRGKKKEKRLRESVSQVQPVIYIQTFEYSKGTSVT